MTATGIISIAAAQYLSKKFFEHRLSKDLKDHDASIGEKLASHKAALDQLVNAAKAESEARLKKELDDYLGEKSVERNYRAEAKKRLYVAVGPLRFQLLVAAAEWANRVVRIGQGKYSYDMSVKGYFGRSTAYRLLRVLAVAELIERQVAFADFAVDPAMRSLLKFKRQAFLTLSSSIVSLGHPDEDWSNQTQHIFYDMLGIISSALIVQEAPVAPSRVIRFDEFVSMVDDKDGVQRFEPVPRLINGFSLQAKPILWLRLLSLAQLCVGLLETHGTELDLEVDEMDLGQMLGVTRDEHVCANLKSYSDAIASFRASLRNK